MKAAKVFLGLLVCAAFLSASNGLAFLDDSATNAEPRFLDKSLSEWIPLARSQGDVFVPRDTRAAGAILEIGTNALPFLLEWVRSDKPEAVQIGIEGLNLLGPLAEPAVPELIRMVTNWQSSSAWSNAIPALAAVRDSNGFHYGIVVLLAAATNSAAPPDYRLRVLNTIVEARWRTNTTAAVYLQCLHDPDWRIVTTAARGLGMGIEPSKAIPALAACFASHTNRAPSVAMLVGEMTGDEAVRFFAMNALNDFSSIYEYKSKRALPDETAEVIQIRDAMRPLIPMLVKALGDNDWRVIRDASDALGNMALNPDLAVPALVMGMDYPQSDVQKAAIEALGNYGPAAHSAVRALAIRAQEDPDGYRGGPWAADALKKIEPRSKE